MRVHFRHRKKRVTRAVIENEYERMFNSMNSSYIDRCEVLFMVSITPAILSHPHRPNNKHVPVGARFTMEGCARISSSSPTM